MLKSLRRKVALRRHPEFDPSWQVTRGHPEALPLREELFWLAVPIADMRAGERQDAKPVVVEFFWRRLAAARGDLVALTSYTSPVLQEIARLAVCGIAERIAETSTAVTEAERKNALELFADLARDGDYEIRITVAETLALLLQAPSAREQALAIAIRQAGDDNYYVAEAAREGILAMPNAAAGLKELIDTGSAGARARAPKGILKLARASPDAVSTPLLDAAITLLADDVIGIRYIAATAFLELAEILPERAAELQAALKENLDSLLPAFVNQFADKRQGWPPSTIAEQTAKLCRLIAPAVEHVVAMLSDDKACVREGGARTICRLGTLKPGSLRLLDEQQRTENDWNTRLWLAAAIEAVTGEALPVERWPVVPAIHQMVFFESENHDAIPAGVRFEPGNPLRGHLKREQGCAYLYWPDDHGVTSSDRLLDDYAPLSLEGEIPTDLDDAEVDVTGFYRHHTLQIESIRPSARRSHRLSARAAGVASVLLLLLSPIANTTELFDDTMLQSAVTIDAESLPVIGVQQFDPEVTVSIALLPGSAVPGSTISVELDDTDVMAIPPQQVLTRIHLAGSRAGSSTHLPPSCRR